MSLPNSYVCPHCGVAVAFAARPILKRPRPPYDALSEYYRYSSVALKSVDVFDLGDFYETATLTVSVCPTCGRPTLWEYEKLVWPVSSGIKAYEKMPEKAKRVFNEAQSLMQLSPRSCCALLRLCVEEIVNYVGVEQGLKNFDPDWILARRIEALAIPETLTQQLTACRVIGNDAAHPGVLDFSGEDSGKVAVLLSHAVNNLCACLIGPFDLKKLADEVEAERKARKNKS